MLDKRLWRPRYDYDDPRRVKPFHPICVKCRVAYETSLQEQPDAPKKA